jgi:DNA-binding transcriptional ArsR family regulator
MVKYQGDLDRILHALADPTRRSIVERLIGSPASMTQLAAPLSMSMPAVLQHVGVLEEAGLVHTEKVGRVRSCRVEPSALRAAEGWFEVQRIAWERRLDRLEVELSDNAAVRNAPKPRTKGTTR